MAAGIIDHETGTRDMRKLGGLFRYMPVTATLAMVASAAMAGVPLLNGFLSKEMFFAEAIETHVHSVLDASQPYVAVLASAFAVTYSLRFIHSVFFGRKPADLPRDPHEPPFWMRMPSMFLVLACLVVGMAPAATVGPYLYTAVESVLGQRTPKFSLAVWHGFNLPLIMSAVALVAGALLYLALKDYLRQQPGGTAAAPTHEWPPPLRTWCPRAVPEMGSVRAESAQHATPATSIADPAASCLRRGAGANLSRQPWPAMAGLEQHRCSAGVGLVDGRRLCDRCGLPGQVSPARCADLAGRCWIVHLHHLCVVLGARSGPHPTRRRSGNNHPDSRLACAGCPSASRT